MVFYVRFDRERDFVVQSLELYFPMDPGTFIPSNNPKDSGCRSPIQPLRGMIVRGCMKKTGRLSLN